MREITFFLTWSTAQTNLALRSQPPTDMMHACESGLIKYINKIFVASMSLSVQVQVDLLIEKTFVGNRQSGKNRFS
jgi:hypothetical protein